MKNVVDRVIEGDVRAAARLIRDIDDGTPEARENLKKLFPHTGRAFIVGVTGSPGVGKSTLTDRLVRLIRDQGKTVGVLCVDPTSPFSGGAILGDRVRMQRHSTDEGVFIRSMATRGQFGGLTQATRGAVMVLDAMGKDCIIVETVGVGQDEVDIARTADTTVIVLVPGMGDDIQAIKAGILEIGDLFVINKADREGVERSIQDIRAMIELGKCTDLAEKEWTPPILKTVANQDQGIGDLWKEVERHQEFLAQNHSEYYHRRIHLKHKLELVELVKQRVVDSVLKKMEVTGALDQYVEDLIARKADPYTLSERILAKFYE